VRHSEKPACSTLARVKPPGKRGKNHGGFVGLINNTQAQSQDFNSAVIPYVYIHCTHPGIRLEESRDIKSRRGFVEADELGSA
jgi:hypothetical protein